MYLHLWLCSKCQQDVWRSFGCKLFVFRHCYRLMREEEGHNNLIVHIGCCNFRAWTPIITISHPGHVTYYWHLLSCFIITFIVYFIVTLLLQTLLFCSGNKQYLQCLSGEYLYSKLLSIALCVCYQQEFDICRAIEWQQKLSIVFYFINKYM